MEQLHAVKTYYSKRHGGLVTLDDDVLSIVRQVRELYDGRVYVNMDEEHGTYHFVEQCEDGTDRLVFSTTELDGRCLTRLQEADSTGRGYVDPYDRVEREQDENHRRMQEEKLEEVRDIAEHLHNALHGTGRVQVSMQGPTIRRGGGST